MIWSQTDISFAAFGFRFLPFASRPLELNQLGGRNSPRVGTVRLVSTTTTVPLAPGIPSIPSAGDPSISARIASSMRAVFGTAASAFSGDLASMKNPVVSRADTMISPSS